MIFSPSPTTYFDLFSFLRILFFYRFNLSLTFSHIFISIYIDLKLFNIVLILKNLGGHRECINNPNLISI